MEFGVSSTFVQGTILPALGAIFDRGGPLSRDPKSGWKEDFLFSVVPELLLSFIYPWPVEGLGVLPSMPNGHRPMESCSLKSGA